MSFVAVAIGGSAALGFGGAMMQSGAARDAARMQQDAANRATEMQWRMFQQQRDDQEPWRRAGVGALTDLGNPDFQRDFTAADFQKDPGYDFRMQQGQQALERSAAARGGLMGGGGLKALSRYGQDYASNEYGNAYNRFNADRDRRFGRLSSIAGIGQTANNQVGAAGQNYANQAGQNMMGAANAAGASGIASANAWGGAMSNAGNNAMNWSMLSKYAKQQPVSSGSPGVGQISGYNYNNNIFG